MIEFGKAIWLGPNPKEKEKKGTLMTIYIVDIEAVDTRYTKQWKEHPPGN